MTNEQREAIKAMDRATNWCEWRDGSLVVAHPDHPPFLLMPNGDRQVLTVATTRRVLHPDGAGAMREASV